MALRGFLGLTGYYCRFILDCVKIASPLSDLLKKERFRAEETFKALKTAMTCALVLALSDFSLPFELECDVSGNEIRVVLMQSRKSIALASRMIFGCARGLSIYEKDLIVIVEAVRKWRPYLLGSQFTIKINHSNVMDLRNRSLLQFRRSRSPS